MVTSRIGIVLNGPGDQNLTLTEFIGSGAFGEVYLAEGLESGDLAAVKLLPLHGLESDDLAQALVNEANLATRVAHQNVVKVLFAKDDESLGPYIVMEHVAGQSLRDFLRTRTGAIELQQALEMMIHISQGARAINEVLVHRDIKPDNILISGSRLRIADFGLSKLVSERTRTHTFKGTGPIKYMAPEAWQFGTNTPKIDVYSVGIVFFEILALKHPLEEQLTDGAPIESWRKAHLFSQTPDIRSYRDDVPRKIAQLLTRMTAKNPANRPGWDEVIQVISTVFSDNPDEDGISSILERATQRSAAEEEQRLSEARERERISEIRDLYLASFGQVVAIFDGIVEAFNSGFQGGQIEKRSRHETELQYDLPDALTVTISLFNRRETETTIFGGTLCGGCYMSISGGPSANLIHVKDSDEDLYGRWIACITRLSVLVDPRAALGRLVHRPPMEPFGFSSEDDFYDHIRWADGRSMHIFKYELQHDLEEFFKDFLEAAFEMDKH